METWLVVTPLYMQTPSHASEGYFHTTHKSNISVDIAVMRLYYAKVHFIPQSRLLGFTIQKACPSPVLRAFSHSHFGTLSEIRTRTVTGLSRLPPTSWAIRADKVRLREPYSETTV